MEKKYKCEKCGSKSNGVASTCCGAERKEMNSCNSCGGEGCMMCNMFMNGSKMTKIIIAIIVIVLIVLAFKSLNKNSNIENTSQNTINSEIVEVNPNAGSYESYAPEKLAFAETGNVVLFFKASWCPTCRALDKNIKENLSAIPTDLKILEVDYDNSQELKQKYGVTTQHTLVQVDKDGNMISKWSGSPTLLSLVAQVK